jgi:acetyl-CoA carboxylase biotin carboxyl carrier protein
MDLKQIHELIKIINKSNIGEISIEDKDGKVTIKQKQEERPVAAVPQQVYTVPSVSAPPTTATVADASPTSSSGAGETQPEKNENYITIKSPMIGTFYRRSAPDKPNFVETGTKIEPGKVLCIIEAMKLFNEIESEISGTLVKILVEDNSPVEFDQPLFLVEPI